MALEGKLRQMKKDSPVDCLVNFIIGVAVSVGDRVLFSKYGYDEVTIGGEDYFIVSEGGVLAVIKE